MKKFSAFLVLMLLLARLPLGAQADGDLFADPCMEVKEKASQLIAAINSKTGAQEAGEKAGAISMGDKCGLQAHSRIVNAFVEHKEFSETYDAFLISQALTVDDPFNDPRAGIALKYFGSNGEINDREFEAGIHILSKVPPSSSEIYLKFLYVGAEKDFMKFEARLRQLLQLAKEGKLGRLTQSDIFSQTLSIQTAERNHTDILWMINTLAGELSLNVEARRTMFTVLQNALFSDDTANIKQLYQDAAVNFLKTGPYDYRIGMQIFNVQRDAYQEILDQNPNAAFYTRTVKRIHKNITPWMCYTYANIPILRSKALINEYIADNNLKCN